MGISVKERSCKSLDPWKLDGSRDARLGALVVDNTRKATQDHTGWLEVP